MSYSADFDPHDRRAVAGDTWVGGRIIGPARKPAPPPLEDSVKERYADSLAAATEQYQEASNAQEMALQTVREHIAEGNVDVVAAASGLMVPPKVREREAAIRAEERIRFDERQKLEGASESSYSGEDFETAYAEAFDTYAAATVDETDDYEPDDDGYIDYE